MRLVRLGLQAGLAAAVCTAPAPTASLHVLGHSFATAATWGLLSEESG